MKLSRLLLAALFYALPTAAFAQCSGIFPAGYVCGSVGGGLAVANPPGTILKWAPSGTGGAARTVASSFQERGVTPTDYGAVPNSNTAGVAAANSTAFVNALTASTRLDCNPSDVYYVQTTILPATTQLVRNCNFITGGSYGNPSAVIRVVSNTANLLVDHISITNNDTTYPGVSLLQLTSAANVTLTNSVFSGGTYPVEIYNSAFVSVQNNTMSNFVGRGIALQGGTSGTFTVTSASPAVFTKTAHGLSAGTRVSLYTNGALYTGLNMGRVYYIIAAGLTANNFEVSLTPGGAAANTSGSQFGTHYVYANGSDRIDLTGNTLTASIGPAAPGIIALGTTNLHVAYNDIALAGHWGIASSFGSDQIINSNRVSQSAKEAIHTDSSVNVSISTNQTRFGVTSTDVGISVSNDNGPLAFNANVVGNSIDTPGGTCIYLVGASYSSVMGNFLKNCNALAGTLNASIALDGSATVQNTIGQNTIEDSVGNNVWQVREANFTSGAPNNNYIFPNQIGTIGTSGTISKVGAATQTLLRATSSASSASTIDGINFDASPFAKRDTGGLSNYLFDYDGQLVGSLGGSGSALLNWGNTTHRWSSRGYGSVYASLDGNGFALNGLTSGTSTIKAPAIAGSGIFTLPASATDTLLAANSTATQTNKTFNTANNTFTVNGVSLDTAWAAYTPTITAGSGTFTTVSATGFFKQIGKSVLVRIEVVITTNGTAAGKVLATLPVAVAAGTISQALGGSNSSTGAGLSGSISPAASTTQVSIFTPTATYPGGSGTVLNVGGVYEVP